MTLVITWQSPSGNVMHITPAQEALLGRHGVWPKDNQGREYCSVAHGLHDGEATFPETAKLLSWCGVERVTVEYMPEQWKDSHRKAGNWGTYPLNMASRESMAVGDAFELITSDPDGYAHIVGGAP